MGNLHHRIKVKTEILRRCAIGAALSLCFLGICGCAPAEIRTAGAEESEFFREYIRKNTSQVSPDQLDQAAEQSLNEYQALTALGEELGICQPYSFEQLQADCEQENEERARKKQTGEVFFGPETLSLDSYFQYSYSALQADILTALLDGRDEAMVAQARAFYDENLDLFTRVASVRCVISENGITQEHVLQRDEFRALGQSDPVLMDFLSEAEDGEEAVLGSGEDARRVKRLGVTTELLDFNANERMIVETYLTAQWIPEWIGQYLDAHKIVF